MYKVYRRIPEMTNKELIFWIKHCNNLNGPWATKIQNACILRLYGEDFDDHSPTHPKGCQTSIVDLGWKSKV